LTIIGLAIAGLACYYAWQAYESSNKFADTQIEYFKDFKDKAGELNTSLDHLKNTVDEYDKRIEEENNRKPKLLLGVKFNGDSERLRVSTTIINLGDKMAENVFVFFKIPNSEITSSNAPVDSYGDIKWMGNNQSIAQFIAPLSYPVPPKSEELPIGMFDIQVMSVKEVKIPYSIHCNNFSDKGTIDIDVVRQRCKVTQSGSTKIYYPTKEVL